MKPCSGVYTITNTITGHQYVGSAINLERRRVDHLVKLRKGTHRNGHLQHAWDKYGETAFQFQARFICAPEECIVWEQAYLDMWEPEYNINRIAGSWLGTKHSPESIAKISAGKKGQSRGPRLEETKAKISAARKGAPVSEEWRARLSAAAKRRRHSSETKAKMSRSHTGIKKGPMSIMHKERLSNSIRRTNARKTRAHAENGGQLCLPL